MTNYESWIRSKKVQYGKKFSDKGLNKDFIPYFENQKRIEVGFYTKEGKQYEIKRGRIGVTTGWHPCFLLMLTTRSLGSSYCIGLNDKIIKEISK